MKKVKALVAFSNGIIAMEQYEVRELPTDMANDLIAAGICVEISGGGSGGGVLVVGVTIDGNTATLDKTWQEIYDAKVSVICMDWRENNRSIYYSTVIALDESIYYVDYAEPANGEVIEFKTDSASGYPSATMG